MSEYVIPLNQRKCSPSTPMVKKIRRLCCLGQCKRCAYSPTYSCNELRLIKFLLRMKHGKNACAICIELIIIFQMKPPYSFKFCSKIFHTLPGARWVGSSRWAENISVLTDQRECKGQRSAVESGAERHRWNNPQSQGQRVVCRLRSTK